ncbi:hypothetical protein ACP6PL_15860 [Dapis sp. BLCC M126]|uniref:hypothetical protein n=1 Tax=Dapis sp. BLCC M126 TaxID=3400189 RepID=UPI003CEF24E3
MNEKVVELIEQIKSCDNTVRRNAIADIGFILETYSLKLSKDERFELFKGMLSPDLREIFLDETELSEIVVALQEEIESRNKETGSLAYLIGNTSAKIGLLPLATAIKNGIEDFNLGDLNQVLAELQNLSFYDDSLSNAEKKDIILKNKLMSKISARILSETPISHNYLPDTYIRLISRLVLFFFDDSNRDEEIDRL